MRTISSWLYDDGARFALACDLLSVALALAAIGAIKAAALAVGTAA
jgi:hypothetical protein